MIRLLLVLLFTSLMAFSAFVAIKVPFMAMGVPRSLPGAEALYQWHGLVFGSHVISAQIMFVWLTGALLGGRRGGLSMALYLALGLGGLPIFTNGGGFSYIQQPTFGYLLAFLPAVVIVGAWARTPHFGRTWLGMALALLTIQTIGLVYELALRGHFFSAEAWRTLTVTQVMQFLPGQVALLTAVAFLVSLGRKADAIYTEWAESRRPVEADEPLLPPSDPAPQA